ncbi:glycosyltransferase [Microbacterium sp. YY-01]|uniref:glycosyltransferase n=1 Tax=Microbacterium sp. YY-01 TaxID=3421634 RepID=UPI003D168172
MKTSTSIVFYDSKYARGGGQVVLEDLMPRFLPTEDIHVVMPEIGLKQLRVPSEVKQHHSLWEFEQSNPHKSVVLVCNANSGMPETLRSAFRLRRTGYTVVTIAIIHNYPARVAARLATPLLARMFNHAIVVEPGLKKIAPRAFSPGWLSLNRPLRFASHNGVIERTNKAKAFGRPDHEKGLDLLPDIFKQLSNMGIDCSVALGTGFSDNTKYEHYLRERLQPWLTDSPKTADWIAPGDIFIVPSRHEAACLTAQEAMSQGALLIVSDVGLMPHMAQISTGVMTFESGNTSAGTSRAMEAVTMSPHEFEVRCKENLSVIEKQAGRWHDEVVTFIRKSAVVDNNDEQ